MSRLRTKETYVKRLLREWPLGFVCGCIVFMLHPMLHAGFAMIDDHEIVSILGRDNQVKISEISPLIQQWSIEQNGRFRPGYYVLRILEAFFAGGDATLWYTSRLLLALVSALALYCGLRVILRPFLAGVATLLFFQVLRTRYGRGWGPKKPMEFHWCWWGWLGSQCSWHDTIGSRHAFFQVLRFFCSLDL